MKEGLSSRGPQSGSSSSEGHTVISAGPPLFTGPERLGSPPQEIGRVLEGEQLGHFQLVEFVGGGGMGAVFRAVDTQLNRTVAVKVLPHEQARDPETQRRFRNEAQSAARLDHANIARVYYVGEDRGVHYIVFEYIEGINLRDLVDERGPLPIADVLHLTLQLSDALAHACQRDVVHRDIKPSNVLITPSGKAKLVDMGLARLHQVEHSNNDLTASGVTLGTFDYISPEQARDPRSADVRSDLYSLGCTIYFLLTGRPPFPEGTVLQKLLQHQAEEPPDPCLSRDDIPAELARIVSKLLAKSPAKRHQSPAELTADLTRLADDLGLPLPGQEGASSSIGRETTFRASPTIRESAWRHHAPWAAAVTVLIASVAILDRVWSRPSESTPLPPIHPLLTAPSDERGADVKPPSPALANSPTPPELADEDTNVGISSAPAIRNDSDREFVATFDRLTAESEANVAAEPQDAQPHDEGESTSDVSADKTGIDLASASSPAASAPAPSAAAHGVLIVAPGHPAPAYPSLRAALAVAPSGAIIELRFNGELVERPLLLANQKLTIRAGEGFSPRLVFRPARGDVDPIAYPRGMITLSGGGLTLIQVAVEFDVPREIAAESWSMFILRGAEDLRLVRSWLTVRNFGTAQSTIHPNVAFVRVEAKSDAEAMAMDGSTAPAKATVIGLGDCVARGEATFLMAAADQVVDVDWNNGLLAVTGRLFQFNRPEADGRSLGSLRADLAHLTIVTSGGLLSVAGGTDESTLPAVEIRCRDSILFGSNGPALIQYESVPSADVAKGSLSWNGERNFYEAYETFWDLGGTPFDGELDTLTRADWLRYWRSTSAGDEIMPGQSAPRFRRFPGRERPLSSHLPSDYQLSTDAAENPARAAATDGTDVGLRLELLPSFAPAPVDFIPERGPSVAPEPPQPSRRVDPPARLGSLRS